MDTEEPLCKKPRLIEDYEEKPANKRKKKNPKFRFKNNGDNCLLTVPSELRVPLMLTDIQELLLHSLLGNSIPSPHRQWYAIDKSSYIAHTVCLVLEGVSSQLWINNEALFSNTSKLFTYIMEIVTPSIYGGSLIDSLAAVPLTESEMDNLIKKYGDMSSALESRKDIMTMLKTVFPIENKCDKTHILKTEDQFPRTQLVLSAQQLIEEGYPFPIKGKLKNLCNEFVLTKDCYNEVTATSPMFALDCEMCMTRVGSELTRISLVNENHETVYETFVKPANEITNYLTQYSGINKSMLENITKTLEDVQKDLREILPPDAILVGQSVNIDLTALKLMHPYIIDTSLIFNFSGERNRKSKLKTLAREFLQENIQDGKHGHCPVEDALTCMKLVQLKLSKTFDYGDAVHNKNKKSTSSNGDKEPSNESEVAQTNQETQYGGKEGSNKGEGVVQPNQQMQHGKIEESHKASGVVQTNQETQYASTIFNHLIQQRKKSIIVCCDDITGNYHDYLTKAHENSTSQLNKRKPKKIKLSTVDKQEDVITEMINAVCNYDFTMGHLKLKMIDDKSEQALQIEKMDNWIRKIYKSLKLQSVFVVIFTGTINNNGIAMINIKNCN